MHLIIQSYPESDIARAFEIRTALTVNANNQIIKSIHDLSETDAEPLYDKHIVRSTGGLRMTFQMAFEYAIAHVPDGEIFAIANNDIFFDTSVFYEHLDSVFFKRHNKLCLFLTRHEWVNSEDGTLSVEVMRDYELGNSQDVFIFKMNDEFRSLDLSKFSWSVGNCPSCENKLAYEMALQGMIPINLGTDLKTFHIDNCRKNGQYDKMVFTENTDYRCKDSVSEGTLLFVPVISYSKFSKLPVINQDVILNLYSVMSFVRAQTRNTAKDVLKRIHND